MAEGLGNQSKEYKQFATAAKRAGFSLNERQRIASNDQTILEGASKFITEGEDSVDAAQLRTFLNILGGNRTQDPNASFAVGNVLYRYRSKRQGENIKEAIPIQEQDRKFVNLAFALIEDAFYSGTLLDLPKEQGAATSFVINVLAKIIEEPKNGKLVIGFDQTKAENFTSAVYDYEYTEMAPIRVGRVRGGQSPWPTNLLRKLRRQNREFQSSREAVEYSITTRSSSIAYLIKTCLIVNGMITNNADNDGIARIRENELSKRRFRSSEIDRADAVGAFASHQFLPQDDKKIATPKYSRQHFLTKEVPFAVWAIRYLRSRKTETSSSAPERK